ncbi:MAG: hypothetical protein Q8O15_07640 [Rectinemataceae bacterium]|nr:hypothetical protein [Rectinemataceae bacterium]
MKKTVAILLMLIFLTSIIFAQATVVGYEYIVQTSTSAGLDRILNTYGTKGWRAISITLSGATFIVIFERPF